MARRSFKNGNSGRQQRRLWLLALCFAAISLLFGAPYLSNVPGPEQAPLETTLPAAYETANETANKAVQEEIDAAAMLSEQLEDRMERNQDNGISAYGRLSVIKGQLVNASGDAVQLKGMSSHGLAWYPEYTSFEAINTTRQYGANLFRIAMYTEDKNGGYCQNNESRRTNKAALYNAIENALSADMYVITDWHILRDSNPLLFMEDALVFFDELSRLYADEPGLIYEICNEPNGNTTWQDIKTYAEAVIPVIRKYSPNAVILVGTPRYASDLSGPIADPLAFGNVMYTYHYYSGDHLGRYEAELDAARIAGLPVFVSEWGLGSSKSGKQLEEAHAVAFLQYLKKHKISWANWSLCNKDEPFSALRADCGALSGWVYDDLSESGRIVFRALGG